MSAHAESCCAARAQLLVTVQELEGRLHAAEVERDAALSTLHAEQALRDAAERALQALREP